MPADLSIDWDTAAVVPTRLAGLELEVQLTGQPDEFWKAGFATAMKADAFWGVSLSGDRGLSARVIDDFSFQPKRLREDLDELVQSANEASAKLRETAQALEKAFRQSD